MAVTWTGGRASSTGMAMGLVDLGAYEKPAYVPTVMKAGSGSGTVNSNSAGSE